MRLFVSLLALTVALPATAHAQAGLRPAPSGRATTTVTLAPPRGVAGEPARITVDYGQPHLRGRHLNTDSLVPYDTPWRTGANDLTTLTTGVDLTLGGVNLPKGTYVLYTLPSRSGWKLIVQRSVGQSPTAYDATHDVGRVDLRQQRLTTPIESLSIWLIPSSQPGPARGELRLAWGTVSLSTDWTAK